jgi:Tfp pilus assembly protein PilZ
MGQSAVETATLSKRPPRVYLPVLVSFATKSFTVKSYMLDVSEGGIFLHTEYISETGDRGRLKFRFSPFDEPFEIRARVVRIVRPGEEINGQKHGMGLQFIELTEQESAQLRNMVDGVQSGSLVAAIRRSIKESSLGLDVVLRSKPTDQKMMLALHASGQEIDALIRDGNPSVLLRLLDCPHLVHHHIRMMLRNRNLPSRVLSAIKRDGKWLLNEELRWLFSLHPVAVLSEAIDEVSKLPVSRLTQLERNMTVRPQVRMKAQELLKQMKSRRF